MTVQHGDGTTFLGSGGPGPRCAYGFHLEECHPEGGTTRSARRAFGGEGRSAGSKARKTRRDAGIITTLICICWILSIGGIAATMQGCGPRHVKAEDRVAVDSEQGPPCVVSVSSDGELVASVKGPNKCRIEVPQ